MDVALTHFSSIEGGLVLTMSCVKPSRNHCQTAYKLVHLRADAAERCKRNPSVDTNFKASAGYTAMRMTIC